MNPKTSNVFIWMMILMMALALSACDKKEKNAQKPGSGETTEVSTPAPTATLAPTVTTAPTATPAPTATTAPTAAPEPSQAPTPTAAPAPTATPVPKATPTSKPTPKPVPENKGTSLLDTEEGELWHMAASYGDFSVESNYSFGGNKLDKAVTVAFGTESIFPGGEVYMVINNAGKKYKSLTLDAWAEEVPADGLGFFCVCGASEAFEPLQEMKELSAGQIKSFTADISAMEEIWIYTGLNPGSKVGFGNIVVK